MAKEWVEMPGRNMFYKPTTPPCKSCEDRHIGCHQSCPKYNTWKAENTAEYERIRPIYQAEKRIEDYIVVQNLRRKKREQNNQSYD